MPDRSSAFYRKAPPDRGASSFVYPATPANITFFAEALRAGCLVAIPTETVYGLAGLALCESSCRSIFSVKGRPLLDPLIVHISDPGDLKSLAQIPSPVEELTSRFWPGPLTLILKKKPIVPDIVTAGRDTVAVRMPCHPVARQLLDAVGTPLAAPSANPFGYLSPTRADHVRESFGEKVPFILDGGPCDIGVESTILDLSDPQCPSILRPGAIAAETLSSALGIQVLSRPSAQSLTPGEAAPAPGTFARHYSPNSPLRLFPAGYGPGKTEEHEAVVFLSMPKDRPMGANTFWLSAGGDVKEMARDLFTLLRRLDKGRFTTIHMEIPDEREAGLLLTLRDRLLRAAAK